MSYSFVLFDLYIHITYNTFDFNLALLFILIAHFVINGHTRLIYCRMSCVLSSRGTSHWAQFWEEWERVKKSFLYPSWNSPSMISFICFLCFKINFNAHFCSIAKLEWFKIVKFQISVNRKSIFKWRLFYEVFSKCTFFLKRHSTPM